MRTLFNKGRLMNDIEHALAMEAAMKEVEKVFEGAFRAYGMALDLGGNEPDPVEPDPVDPPPSSSFKVFDLLRYKNRPSSAAMGMHPIKIWYESAFYPGGVHEGLPNKADVQALARQAPADSILDIEHWLPSSNWKLTTDSAAKYAQVMKWYKEALGAGKKAGYYGVIPGRNYWDALRGPGDDRYHAWQQNNDLGLPIMEHCDYTFPSVYTFYEDRPGWAKYAMANVAEARRVSGGKPVYAVLWPEYHVSNAKLRGQPIEPDYFRFQLDTLRPICDGVVIWTISRVKTIEFSNIPGWYQETQDFLGR